MSEWLIHFTNDNFRINFRLQQSIQAQRIDHPCKFLIAIFEAFNKELNTVNLVFYLLDYGACDALGFWLVSNQS